MGRLKSGYTESQAEAEMSAITHTLAEAYPRTNKDMGAHVMLYERYVSPALRQSLNLLMITVGLVLLIACANVANLLLARGVSRRKEISVRIALGASKMQLLRQFFTESLTLALMGGLLGVALGWMLLRIFEGTLMRSMLPAEAEPGLNLAVLGFACAAALLSGLIFGCAPAWRATRLNLNEAMKEGSHSAGGGARHRLQRVFVVVEFALALTVLTGAGLAIHSLWNLRSVNLGFRGEHVLSFVIPVEDSRFARPESVIAFYDDMVQQFTAIPGVRAVSASTGMPLGPIRFGLPFEISGVPADPAARTGSAVQLVTASYFEAFGIRLLRGRYFTPQDAPGTQRVAIVNESFVKRYLSAFDPVTKSLSLPDVTFSSLRAARPAGSVTSQIVGVVQDVRTGDLRDFNPPTIYLAFRKTPRPLTYFAVRTAGDPNFARGALTATVGKIDPDLPLDQVMTMDEVVDQSVARDRFGARLLGAFAGLSLLLAVIGIYSVMAFTVAQRRHEIGLRIALGAGHRTVVAMVLKQAARLAFAGIVVGLGGAYYAHRWMGATLYDIGPVDPASFAVVALLLLTVALAASYVPARRASQVDPVVSLRED